jgi:hypothetical protein
MYEDFVKENGLKERNAVLRAYLLESKQYPT